MTSTVHPRRRSNKVSSLVPTDINSDDYIGLESCVDLKGHHTAADITPLASFPEGGNSKRDNKTSWMGRKNQKNYPPPIPLLVRTENLASHIPWVMKRQYTGDGRLILTEEKVKHHEFFRAHRSDGRLMLQLVTMDDQELDEEGDEEEEEEEEEECTEAGGSEGGKWCKYENVRDRDTAFMFGVEVAAGSLRSVRG
ncbi:uncharacterized protein LOC111489066 [Cucurbita maxima]|uniref:Uncharacterized protein LOC111489066 n=1 Tax=Cucurbita maxima TaxID=3661 RepID=A0A6J1JUP6_CUCMA|nr:uncharacterized protein LOC111489066 [Cucurbita maxima]